MTVSDPTVVPTEVEWHRAAAWFAGEGSVRSKDRKLGVTVAQKERTVLEWFLERFGGSIYYRPAKGKSYEIYYWQVCGDRARAFLRGIQDLMPESPRRIQQVKHALDVTAGRLKTGPKPQMICKNGHEKHRGNDGRLRCRECDRITQNTYRGHPEPKKRHREREHDRYHQRKGLENVAAINR